MPLYVCLFFDEDRIGIVGLSRQNLSAVGFIAKMQIVAASKEAALKGTEEMSRRFKERGAELYLPQSTET